MSAENNLHTKAWLTKALHDQLLAEGALKEGLPFDAGIFHCQQSAEKCLKGFLLFHNIRFSKTHDLTALIHQCAIVNEEFKQWLSIGDGLTNYAIEYRYPDDLSNTMPSENDFRKAIEESNALFEFVLAQLPKEVHPI